MTTSRLARGPRPRHGRPVTDLDQLRPPPGETVRALYLRPQRHDHALVEVDVLEVNAGRWPAPIVRIRPLEGGPARWVQPGLLFFPE